MKIQLLTLVFAIACCVSAGADEITRTSAGNAGNIPDANSAGLTSTVTITPGDITPGHVVRAVDVTLNNIQHSWVGDLVVTLRHSATGRTADLFNRVGRNSTTTGKGDSSNLNGNYTFRDGSPSFWTESAEGGDAYTMASGTYRASTADETPFNYSLNNIFGETSPIGNWTVTVADLEGGNVGSYSSATLNITTAIPEPSAIAGIGLLGLFGSVYLRRRFLARRKLAAAAAN